MRRPHGRSKRRLASHGAIIGSGGLQRRESPSVDRIDKFLGCGSKMSENMGLQV